MQYFCIVKREDPDIHKVCDELLVVPSCKIDLEFKIQLSFFILGV
jgi:hypothetical protein